MPGQRTQAQPDDTPKDWNEDVMQGSSFLDERLWYDQFTSIDWVHDSIKDGIRLRELRSRKDFKGRMLALFDGAQGWILVAVIGCITAAIAYFVDIADKYVFELRDGICVTSWLANRKACCSSERYCENWHSWPQLLGLSQSNNSQSGDFIFYVLSAILMAVGACAWLVPRVSAQWILAIGVFVALASNVVLVTMPVRQSYWPQMFPSMVLMGFCPDLVYVAAQLVASNSVSRQHQGVASSLIGTLNLYGNSLGLGFSGTVESEIRKTHSEVMGYRAALYFGAGLGLVGLILDLMFVRVPKDDREGWEAVRTVVEKSRTSQMASPENEMRRDNSLEMRDTTV